MKKTGRSYPVMLWPLLILLIVIAIGALVSGPMLFLSPDGEMINLPSEILEGTPFDSFLWPGIILTLFVGIFPVLVSYGLLKRPRWGWAEAINPCKNYHWSWTASWATGVIMLIWILVEIMLIGYLGFLQPMVIVWGVVIIGLTFVPPVRKYYRVN